MLFNSLEFIIFFPIVVAIYFMLNHKYRWILLLVASYYFYMCWNYNYIILIVISTVIDYISGIQIHKSKSKAKKKAFLILSLAMNLGLLFFFKYFNFFGESVNAVFDRFNIFYNVPSYQFLLPVGISFYTFQTLSYTIDVYMGNKEPEKHFGIFAVYVSFFPQLVAGPIERSSSLLPQFYKKVEFDYERIKSGLLQMAWGFFKKVVIADRLAEYVNIVYNNPTNYGGWHFIIATLFFSMQIYCDFSGYSDIAIGTARIMGINLMTNFRRPYFAMNIREFWQRWHISLSTWFRDYLYIPLGGNRVLKWRWYMNLFLTFLISGLWHGANWTFVIWGALHGFYLVFAIWTQNARNKFNDVTGISKFSGLMNSVQVITTFALVYFAWIFFRANSLSDAFLIINNHFDFSRSADINLYRIPSEFYIAVLSILALLSIEYLEENYQFFARVKTLPVPVKWTLLAVIILAIFVIGVWDEVDFLYFQF
jgi:alginate O-acetyltransferase complex protein AlgI